MSIRDEIRPICDSFLTGLRNVLGQKLHGVYVYGAAAFPETLPTGDIDFHVILRSALTDEERSDLEDMHENLACDFPPLGGELDGYYILLDDARQTTPPRSEMWKRATDDSWALHREYIRSGRHIVLHGPDPLEIYPAVTWPEIEQALMGELHYVRDHLGEYPDYCILNLCRLVYSFETHDVVISKAAASEWALNARPGWRKCIELAVKSYSGRATSDDREYMLEHVPDMFRDACMSIGADL
jgi:hypothetical protein